MKVLILGGAGYIGSVLSEHLSRMGDEVTIFDNLLYEESKSINGDFRFVHGDICNTEDLLPEIENTDAVVNLAAISNDPASDISPNLTWEINYKANKTIAMLCKSAGKRVVYASSCSVYGFADKGVFTENNKSNPQSLYAKTKMLSEKYYHEPGVDSIILRFATVYGDSPKPRFDLVVNTMIGTSYFEKKIVVNGGEQWRPVVHVKDVSHAIYLAIHAQVTKNRIFNVGSNDQNFKIAQLGSHISKHLPKVKVEHLKDDMDTRSYLVDFTRIEKELKFKTEFKITDAIEELYKKFKKKEITTMDEDVYFRVKYLKKRIPSSSYRKRVFIERLLN